MQMSSADSGWLERACVPCADRVQHQTGIRILDQGVDSLLIRAWLARRASRSIDVQYFIWSTDNIGILASTELLAAADRGVRIRVLVDDLLIDAEDRTLLALAAHPRVEIRIYNPQHSVGVSGWQRAWRALTDFRGSNQRMHDKTAIFDGVAGVTGGRNMADEYYDFDHEYNFRDRDVLLVGQAVAAMSENFEEFWHSELAVPVSSLVASAELRLSEREIADHYAMLRRYAGDPQNFAPEVRAVLAQLSRDFPALLQQLVWDDVRFISDAPGKNPGLSGLRGGGESTAALTEILAGARQSVLIQTPYLVMPEGGIELLAKLVEAGVRVRISTNSLASTDNLMAFSGYYKQRRALLDVGVEIFEFKPDAAIRARLIQRAERVETIFALHAKSLVVDGRVSYIGTFNLDPRSANLNTEVGVVVDNAQIAAELSGSIETDLLPENSWSIRPDFNPDGEVGWGKRLKLWFYSLLPLNPVL